MQVTVPWSHEAPSQFTTAEEITAWADEELGFWRKFQPGFGAGPLAQAFNWSSVENGFQQFKGAATQSRPENEVQGAASNIPSYVAFSSRHEIAQFMSSLLASGEDPQTLSLIYVLFKQPDLFRQAMNQQELFVPALKAAYHLTAVRQKRHDAALPAFTEKFSAYAQETTSALTKAQDELRSAEQQRADWSKRADETIQKQATQFGAQLGKLKSDLTELQRDYSERFALRAPMEYWSKKATDHKQSATFYRNWFVGLLAAGAVGLGLLAYRWLLPELHKTPTVLWPVVLFSALLAIWAWPVRLASKFYLSQRHLFEDCRERQVIAQDVLGTPRKS